MSTFLTLVNSSTYFPRLAGRIAHNPPHYPNGFTIDALKQSVQNLLGADFAFKGVAQYGATGLVLYDSLSQILPFSPQTAFFWKTIGYPFASMMDTAGYSLQAQTAFLVFVYARVLGFMGPEKYRRSMMTDDGSSTELSWVIPNSSTQKGEPNRRVRFAIEPMDPISGKPLLGRDVLNYFASPEGGIGVVKCKGGWMDWFKLVESFLFPDFTGDEIPADSRFFVGFDFSPSGTLTLKAYFLPAPFSGKPRSPVDFLGKDFHPLRNLVRQLDSSMENGLERMLEHFDSLEDQHKPGLAILAVDCVPSSKNRLKIYFRTPEGTSFSHVKQFITLGGRQVPPKASETLANLEILWNNLFPAVKSSSRLQLGDTLRPSACDLEKGQHTFRGIIYYYELACGEELVFPKVYLSVRNYCSDDLTVARAIEAFYDMTRVSAASNKNKGWFESEISRAYNHRPLDLHTGIQTYVTFALKRAGWELTSYFSPETWFWLQKDHRHKYNLPRARL